MTKINIEFDSNCPFEDAVNKLKKQFDEANRIKHFIFNNSNGNKLAIVIDNKSKSFELVEFSRMDYGSIKCKLNDIEYRHVRSFANVDEVNNFIQILQLASKEIK